MEEAARRNVTVPFERLTVALEELEEEAARPAAVQAAATAVEAAAAPKATAAETPEADRPQGLEEQALASQPAESEEPSQPAVQEVADPLAGFLGTWSYMRESTFRVLRDEDGQLLLVGELTKGNEVTGQLRPEGDDLLGEVRPSSGGSPLGTVRLRLGEAPATALVAFRRAGKETWGSDFLSQLLEATMPQPAAAAPPAAEAAAQPTESAAEAEARGNADMQVGADAQEFGDSGMDSEEDSEGEEPRPLPEPARRFRLQAYAAQPQFGGSAKMRAVAQENAEAQLQKLRDNGPPAMRRYLARRHRFIDPMYRRRRLKWIERTMAEKNKETEVKFNSYYTTHPDDQVDWPTNKGSVTVVWPSPYH